MECSFCSKNGAVTPRPELNRVGGKTFIDDMVQRPFVSCRVVDPDYRLTNSGPFCVPRGVGSMKVLFCVISLIMAFTLSAAGQKTVAAKPDPAKGVREAFDRLTDGIRQLDADKVMAVYENSPKLLIFNNNGSATIGWDNVKSNVTSSYAKLANVTLDITGLRVEMLGKTSAYVTCKWKQTQENEGKLEDASGRMSLVFRLIGKDWKIVHRHTSPDNPGPTRPLFESERPT